MTSSLSLTKTRNWLLFGIKRSTTHGIEMLWKLFQLAWDLNVQNFNGHDGLKRSFPLKTTEIFGTNYSLSCSVELMCGFIFFHRCQFHEGSGTLSMPKCPIKTHIFGMWNHCPHPYTTLLRKAFPDRTLRMRSRAFWMSQILHIKQWDNIWSATAYHSQKWLKIIFTWRDLRLFQVQTQCLLFWSNFLCHILP